MTTVESSPETLVRDETEVSVEAPQVTLIPMDRPSRMREFLRSIFQKPPYYGLSVLGLVAVVGIWWLVKVITGLSSIVLPSPIDTWKALSLLITKGDILGNLGITLSRAGFGLVVGMALGVILGMLIALSPRFRAVVNPIMSVTFPIPKIAVIPLFVIWFGLGFTSEVMIIITTVMYVSLYNTVSAVESIPPVLTQVFLNLGASRRETIRKLIIPAAVPGILAALRIAFASSLVLAIASEMLVGNKGLGFLVSNDGQLLNTPGIFAIIIVLGALGIAGFWLIQRLESWALRWK